MDEPDEPPFKRAKTDFKLCLYCQEQTEDRLTNPDHKLFKETSYNTFLNCVREKANYKNTDFVRVANRLHNIDATQLKTYKATWHRACYGEVTRNTVRDQTRYKRAVESNDVSSVIRKKRGRPCTPTKLTANCASTDMYTRSQMQAYDPQKCIFCQSTKFSGNERGCGKRYEKNEEGLINCRTSNRGKDIQEIVRVSGNQIWEIRLANVLQSGDLLSRDVVYHHSCFTLYWSKYMRKVRQTENNNFPSEEDQKLEVIAGEVQFLCSVQDEIDQGKFLSMPVVENMYQQALSDFGVADPAIDRQVLKKLLLENLDNVNITSSLGRTPSQVHSKDAGSAAIHTAAATQREPSTRERLKLLYKCSRQIRHSISSKGRDWKFTGSLRDSITEGIPDELSIFIKWIIKGHGQASTINVRMI